MLTLPLAFTSLLTQAPTIAPVTCRVTRVVDGDTVRCNRRRVRLLLIDSPEMSQAPFGRRAASALRRLIPVGTVVRLEYDKRRTDRYGRDLAYVFAPNGTFVNAEMVRQGFAVPLEIPPNLLHASSIRTAARLAKGEKAGLWRVGGFECMPANARAKRCR